MIFARNLTISKHRSFWCSHFFEMAPIDNNIADNLQKKDMKDDDYEFIDIGAISNEDMMKFAEIKDEAERHKKLKCHIKPASTISKQEFLKVTPMPLTEEIAAMCVFLFGVPGFGITFPVGLVCLWLFYGKMIALSAVLLVIPLAFIPYKQSDSNCYSWLGLSCLRYFSHKALFRKGKFQFQKGKPYILVAPPHGVFPYGNICAMLSFPSLMGFSFNGLASFVVFRTPVLRHFLGWIGAIDASAPSASRALRAGRTVGISTGGVAEIFETNSVTGDEVIVLRERKGLIKLAFRTGASLVPCYLFGNNQALSLWYDQGGILRRISRRLGFALILFWGRFGLPIPWRVPVIGAFGEPIEVEMKQDPTVEEVDQVQEVLLAKMVELFDAHKARFGWGHKRLVIR